MARGKRPAPFRTRKLSLSAPMVLQVGTCGRVGHRRTYKHPREASVARGCCGFRHFSACRRRAVAERRTPADPVTRTCVSFDEYCGSDDLRRRSRSTDRAARVSEPAGDLFGFRVSVHCEMCLPGLGSSFQAAGSDLSTTVPAGRCSETQFLPHLVLQPEVRYRRGGAPVRLAACCVFWPWPTSACRAVAPRTWRTTAPEIPVIERFSDQLRRHSLRQVAVAENGWGLLHRLVHLQRGECGERVAP